ncbi:MAG: L-ribulose-5-phosphate 4-epimerase [Anaerolineae bacterium]|nr:class II aldolase/adducin family protein [Anaerolineales bacterium]MCQ3976944.1 L-ribulose-5-phosphate 4-epimerase [Anaerolineae bacterium]
MALEALRQEVWKCNLELPKNGLVKMTSGNVSGRDPETNLVVIKPSGYSYEDLTPADMVIVNLEGDVVEGHLKPSVDTATHLYIYRHRPDVFGVAHTHSPYASSFAALGQSIPACLTTTAMLGGEIPLGGYVPIGGEAIGEEIVRRIGHSLAIVMQNHGVFTIGKSARQATKMAVEVEEIAHITHLALLRGQPIMLTPEQIADVSDLYTFAYGQK